MKKTSALLIAASMLLTSCVNTAVPGKSQPDESTPYPTHGSSVTSCGFDLNNLNYDPQPGIIDSTMRIAGEISPYMGERWASAPSFCLHGQYTYMIRQCPGEIISNEEYEAFRAADEPIREIEVYENYDYSEPVRVIQIYEDGAR